MTWGRVQCIVGVAVLSALFVARPGRADWAETIDRVSPAVVVLHVVTPRGFDGARAGSSTATGFVVDAERGLILTNRHVVDAGPTRAQAVFLDHEEVDVQAVYRDPVHDFGFFRFDPEDVRFMEVSALDLAPRAAKVGREIRVIGNDAGEKLSILAGTLARLDRAAPYYGPSGYNDFNTFYYQAASGTSGGSSGSPVIDETGRVIALNAGGRRGAASSFYLPLDRVARALDFIRRGEPVPRGTLQTVFEYTRFDELRRLGLRTETESIVRGAIPQGTGMLVVAETVPGGPGAGKLLPGDILVQVEGKLVTSFLEVDRALDDRVGESVAIEVERGGEQVAFSLPVGDLHAITPSAFLEYGGGVLHELSYQQARNHGVPAGGVFVSEPGYQLSKGGIPRGAVITHLGGDAVPTLDDFVARLEGIREGERVPVRYFPLSRPRQSDVSVVTFRRRWFSARECVWDAQTGRWPCVDLPTPLPAAPAEPATARLEAEGLKALRTLAPSIVTVQFNIPYRLDGVQGDSFRGSGLIVDTDQGLVVVDRETVPIALGDLSVTFGGSVRVPAEVVYLHPEHNFAVIRYAPEQIAETPVRAARLRAAELRVGDEVVLVGATARHRLVAREAKISRRESVVLAPAAIPRFRERNLELVAIGEATASIGGVLADCRGRVLALWASFARGGENDAGSFFAGIPIQSVIDVIEPLREGRAVGWRSLGAEFVQLPLSEARERGLPEADALRLERRDPRERRVLSVLRTVVGSPASGVLEVGDLIVEVNGGVVTRPRALEQAAQAGSLILGLVRDGEPLEVEVETQVLSGNGTQRALLWAGGLLQEPHLPIQLDYQLPPGGVYLSWLWFGSPVERYPLNPAVRIFAVDGQATPDLDAFIEAVRGKADGEAVRLNVRDLEDKPSVVTLKLDLESWPTQELRYDGEVWTRDPVVPVGD